MTDHRPDSDLPEALTDLKDHIAYPPTPDLAGRIRQILQSPGRPLPGRLRGATLAAAVVFFAAAIVLAAMPGAREAVAGFLGLRGLRILAGEPPSPSRVGPLLNLGEQVDLRVASARAGRPVLIPAELGPPDEVYFAEPPPGGLVTLVWLGRPGLPPAGESGVGGLLMQFPGRLEPAGFVKVVGPNTRLEEVEVGGGRGYWIEGDPHVLFYRDAGGRVQEESMRLVGNALIWERGPITLRLEVALSKQEALGIAGSVR